MDRGWTKRYRKRWDKGYHRDPLLWVLMDYFIDFANYKDTDIYFPNVGTIPLKRGQHIFGTRKLAAFMRVDRQVIRTKLRILKNIGFLTLQPTHQYTIATILNYNVYQSMKNEANPLTNQDLTHSKPTPNPQLTRPKKEKKEKEEKNKRYTSDSSEIRLSNLLLEFISSRNEKFKKPNIQTWAIHIDRALRLDDRTLKDLETVIRWCQGNPFWQNNILSTQKLREKFDQLYMQMKERKDGKVKRDNSKGNERPGSETDPGKYDGIEKTLRSE